MKIRRIGILPWSPETPNPYQRLTAKSLQDLGYQVIDCKYIPFFPISNVVYLNNEIDGLVLDWVHSFYTSQTKYLTYLKSLCGPLDMFFGKKRKFPIIWNIHNLHRHDMRFVNLETRSLRMLSRNVDGIRVFHPGNVEVVRRQLNIPKQTPIIDIPQPNYTEHYNHYPVLNLREELNIPNDHLVLMIFGSIRRGKGILNFLQSFVRSNTPNTTLVVAGNIVEPSLEEVVSNYKGHERIKLVLRHIQDLEVKSFFELADIIVLPYEQILNSGVATLALGFGKPILANKIEGLSQNLSNEFAFIEDLFDPEYLGMCLSKLKSSDLVKMGEMAKKESDQKYDNRLNTMKLVQFMDTLTH